MRLNNDICNALILEFYHHNTNNIMKRYFLSLFLLLSVFLSLTAQKKYSVYAVGFYNLENLFDTCHDEGKNDYEFLPSGSYHWNELKYSHKLRNMARALSDMGTDVLPNVGCSFIGVSEVENSKVLDDLVSRPELKARNFQYAHIEGPDRRGIDCALLYNPKFFRVTGCKLFPYVPALLKDSAYKTRGYFAVNGVLANEKVTVIVCHWPSRYATSFYRETAGEQVKALKDSLLGADPDRKVFVMGDMNDDPTNKSMVEKLSAKGEANQVGEGDMYNPWYDTLVKKGQGTLMYKGSWNLFDQIVMSPNLLSRGGKRDLRTLKYWKHAVQRMPYLFQTEGKYKGSPKRTTAGGVWLDGYSDHLPVCVYLVKEQK